MDFAKLLKTFSSYFPTSKLTKKSSQPLTVMLLSPHPDDESINGSLALRLALENNWHVVNVAITLGSNKERQSERKIELDKACALLECECLYLSENWKTKEKELKSLIQKYHPYLIITPHLKDYHPTHIKTGELCKKVLTSLKNFSTLVAWCEFWGSMKSPNILVEVPIEILELQMKALELHQGEIKRNPYHLRLPAWMMDNVRRGSELIGGKGAEASQIAYGVLYKLQLFDKGKFKSVKLPASTFSYQTDIGQMFKLILDAASGSKIKVK